MAAPVWVLSVDLQTKTATFQTGMADAAKTARGAFTDIKSGAGEMGGHVSTNMFAARHSIMAVSEAFGGQMPRAITAFVAHLGPVGPALEAAFPLAAIGLGAVLLIEHLAKLREEGQQLTQDQVKFGTAVQNAFNSLDQKLLQAQIRSDELRNDHLGALHHQLELIDKTSMAELVHQFAEVAKSADVVFGELKSNWYSFGIGSAGAKHALDDFQANYDSLLAKGKDKDASDLLKGTRESAEKVISLQKQASATGGYSGVAQGGHMDHETQMKLEEARNGLKASGVGWSEKEVKAQEALVQALQAQVDIEERVATLKKQDGDNASVSTGKEMAALRAEAARTAAEHSQKMGEISLQADREMSQASLDIQNASVMQRLLVDMQLADRQRDIQLQGNTALQNALDKGGKDYNNQLQALRDKAVEITAQHSATIAELTAKAAESQHAKSLQDMEASEREQIDATQQGSAARLASIAAAIKNEETLGLQGTQHYRELQQQKVEVTRQAAEEQAKLSAEAGKESAENEQKLSELSLASELERMRVIDSARRMTTQMQIAEEVQAANAEFALKQAALQKEQSALDKGGKDYQNKLKELQDKEKQLVQQHENDITAIKDRAELERNAKIMSAEQRFNDEVAAGLTQVLMGHKSFASMMNSIGDQVVSGMMENAIKSVMANNYSKESDAAKAARQGFLDGSQFPFPANIIMGPMLAAKNFAAVMAFAGGTDSVPGQGNRDTVPAMLTPGEGVVPGGVMDGLRNMVRTGNGMGGNRMSMVHAPTYHLHLIDGTGVKEMLRKHDREFTAHFHNEVRKMNK